MKDVVNKTLSGAIKQKLYKFFKTYDACKLSTYGRSDDYKLGEHWEKYGKDYNGINNLTDACMFFHRKNFLKEVK